MLSDNGKQKQIERDNKVIDRDNDWSVLLVLTRRDAFKHYKIHGTLIESELIDEEERSEALVIFR